MSDNTAHGNAHEQNKEKEQQAKAETQSGQKKDQTNMQAGSGGRGGHRKREGGPPEGK